MKIKDFIDKLIELDADETDEVVLRLGDEWNGYDNYEVFSISKYENGEYKQVEIFGEINTEL
jgi:hypothetical protein